MRALGQLVRYGIVGLTSNGILYVLYLVLTHFGLGPKLAATLAYGAGLLQAFVFNRSWTFKSRTEPGPALLRFILAYGVGYAVNMLGLELLVDLARLPHQLVQAAMILVVAALLFLIQKFWVFRSSSAGAAQQG